MSLKVGVGSTDGWFSVKKHPAQRAGRSSPGPRPKADALGGENDTAELEGSAIPFGLRTRRCLTQGVPGEAARKVAEALRGKAAR
jgi:hypothetical protein